MSSPLETRPPTLGQPRWHAWSIHRGNCKLRARRGRASGPSLFSGETTDVQINSRRWTADFEQYLQKPRAAVGCRSCRDLFCPCAGLAAAACFRLSTSPSTVTLFEVWASHKCFKRKDEPGETPPDDPGMKTSRDEVVVDIDARTVTCPDEAVLRR